MKFMQRIRKGKKGFTLIELLVVIAILGVIAAVAVPNVLKFMNSGDSAAQQAELHNVQVAVTAALYDDTDHLLTAVTDRTKFTTSDSVVGPYLVNNCKWWYTYTANGQVTQHLTAS